MFCAAFLAFMFTRRKYMRCSLQVVHSFSYEMEKLQLSLASHPPPFLPYQASRRSHATVFEVFPPKICSCVGSFSFFKLCEEKTFSCHDAFVLFSFSASFFLFFFNGKLFVSEMRNFSVFK